jgi:hypothetical protein
MLDAANRTVPQVHPRCGQGGVEVTPHATAITGVGNSCDIDLASNVKIMSTKKFRTEDDENADRKATHVRESLSHRFQEFLLENETFGWLHSLQVKVTFRKTRLKSFFVNSRAGLEFSQWRCPLSSSSIKGHLCDQFRQTASV